MALRSPLQTGASWRRVIGNQEGGDVHLVVRPPGLTFIEGTPSGNVIVTTAFPHEAESPEEFTAVQSRHVDIMGSPLPSQWHGTCKIFD